MTSILPVPGAGASVAELHAVEVATQRLAAAGALVGLAARDVRGCVGLFASGFRHLSPARGALLVAAPCVLANLHACAAVVDGAHWRRLVSASPTAQLAAALFHKHAPEEPPRASQLRSLPAAYLDASMLGHFAGLAQRRASEVQIHAALREHCGIAELARESGVTIARFVRFGELVRSASEEGDEYGMESALGAHPGTAVLLRLLWERAKGRGCLLDYARALAAHVPEALSDVGRRVALEEGAERAAWLGAYAAGAHAAGAGSPAALPPPLRPRAAAAAIAAVTTATARSGTPPPPPSAELAEALAARLLARVTHKPLVQQGRYGYREQPARPDCVEACVRELVEMLLYDPTAAALDARRLPPDADPALRAFVARREYAASDAGGQAWFDLCSAIPGIGYLAGAGRDRYELAPELGVLTAVTARLLGLGSGCETVEELARRWNALSPFGPRLRGWATSSSFVVQEVAWFELLPQTKSGASSRAPLASPSRGNADSPTARTPPHARAADDAIDAGDCRSADCRSADCAAAGGTSANGIDDDDGCGAYGEDASVGPTIVIALRPNSNHAFARRPPAPLCAELSALRAALLRAAESADFAAASPEWSWLLPALASGELLLADSAASTAPPGAGAGAGSGACSSSREPQRGAGGAGAADQKTAARILWADLVHARARLTSLRAAAAARGPRCEALAPWLLEPLASERDARLSVAVARALVESGWATEAHAVRASALRQPLLALTLALLQRDWRMLAAAWAQARRDGESLIDACGLLCSAIGVAWMPDR